MASRKIGYTSMNQYGGFFHIGDPYPHEKKTAVVHIFLEQYQTTYPFRPTYTAVAKEAKVCVATARKYITELLETGEISDPKAKKILQDETSNGHNLTMLLDREEEQYLLTLRSQDTTTPLAIYRQKLIEEFGKEVSISYLHNWWKYRFQFRGTLRKSIHVPKDKFTEGNWLRYYKFRIACNVLHDHTMFNFIDEKHIVNHNGQSIRGRVDPVTGVLDGIPVSGDFRDANNIICCISGNHRKLQHLFYAIRKANTTSETFMDFIETMVAAKFLRHNEVLVMDNAAIHIGRESQLLEDYLWTTIVEGRPLNVYVLYLPPRAPELNPIELVFNILVQRLKGYHHRNPGGVSEGTLDKVESIFESMSYETILNCFFHCGYLKLDKPQPLT